MRALALLAAMTSLSAAAQAPGRDATAQWITLGTGGGPVVQLERGQPANAVVVGDAVYLFDAGEGTQARLKAAGLGVERVRAVFLSHHHLDHVGGIGPIVVNRWILGRPDPLPVFGPPGTREMVAGLLAAARPTERSPLLLDGAPVRPVADTATATDLPTELAEPREVFRDGNVRVLAAAVDHYHDAQGRVSRAAYSYAYRVEAGGRSFVYTGDTGPSAALERLAKGADVLVAEVMDRPAIAAALERMDLPPAAKAGFMRHMDLDHLTPPQVGALARRAGVGRVVLTHLVPGRDEETGTDGYTAGLSREFNGPVAVARDGDRF